VVGGGCSVVAPTNTGHPVEPLERPPEPERNPAEATGTCTMEVDDYSRVVYSEILDDERKDTAAGFWIRAADFFASLGVEVGAVMTDNGACYRSHAFADALGPEVKHRWTRPYRPQTNGKVERFNRTLMTEWAYARPYLSEASREQVYGEFIEHYNRRRAHTGIGGLAPMDRVHNLTGNYS
jgi:transposase InsO family protein